MSEASLQLKADGVKTLPVSGRLSLEYNFIALSLPIRNPLISVLVELFVRRP